MRSRALAAALALAMSASWAGRAVAERITFAFTGTITELTDNSALLEDSLGLGSAIYGSLSFESSLPNVSLIPNQGVYGCIQLPGLGQCPDPDDLAVLVLQVGATRFESGGLTVRIANEAPGSILFDDQLFVFGAGLTDDPGGSGQGSFPLVVQGSFSLVDSSDLALDSVALPTSAPDLDRWESARFSLRASHFDLNQDRHLDYLVAGDIVSIAVVPEPGTLMLSSMGMLAIAWRRRSRS